MTDRDHACRSPAGPTAVARDRIRVVALLSGAVVVAYFGFMGLFAFDKPLLGTALAPGLTLGLVLGPALILAACVISFVYVLWANLVFDPSVAALAARAQGETP